MTATRAIREFRHRGDPWPTVDDWATANRYRTIEAWSQRRLYRKGRGWFVQPRMVQLIVYRGLVHMEAWLAKPWFDTAPGLRVPPEITIEPGKAFGSIPRRKARSEVNELIEALHGPPITESADPDDRLSSRISAGIEHATASSTRGDFEAAIAEWETVLPLAERRFGRLSGLTLTGALDEAVALLESGHAERAIDVLRELIPDLEVVVGLEASWTLNAKETLAVALAASGREAEARDLAQRTVEELERILGSDHPTTVGARARFERRDWRTGGSTER